MTLYIVRHGESEGNAEQTHQTEATVLSKKGLIQAKEVAARFRSVPINCIISSTAQRALQTAQEIQKVAKVEIEENSNFKEKFTPSEIHHKSWRSPEVASIWKQIEAHDDDPTYHFSDEENNWDFIKRISLALTKLEHRSEENLLLVSHGFVIRTIVGLILFGSEFSSRQFTQMIRRTLTKNTGVTVCTYTENAGWQLLTYNDHAHLLE